MKTSRLKASCILLSLLIGLGFLIPGYGKAAQPASTPDPAATEKEFLSDPDTAICELEKTTIYSLGISKNRQPSFIRRMERANRQDLKQAKITVANREFKVLLGERPEREFFLFDVEKDFGPYWWGSWSLHSHHKIGDQFFEFMLVEDGAKIAGRPYKGELGTIKVGKGGRDLEKVEFNGSVEKAGYVSAPVGNIKDRWPDPVGKCEIPVGDYTANIMDVIYDKLHITISNNYHTNAQGQSGAGRETVYGMRVRKDKPYVLDFTNKPMVIFDKPSGNRPCSRGNEIKFAAVMIDPKLDIMIRRLNDTSVMVDKEYKDGSGKVIHTAKRPKSLDPKVVIARDDGEIVAEGVMPFG